MSASPLPVLMVIADQNDFYYKEYGDTRNELARQGVGVAVAATTTNPSTPHANSGQVEAGVSGVLVPDIALANVNPADYSAIAFVGGWGSSMYQYAYNDPDLNGTTDNFYFHGAYNGDDNLGDGVIAPQKVVVNNLINDFLAADKPVAAICHGVTVLAWARVDGVSPLAGKHVVVPTTVSAPSQFYNGAEQDYPYNSGQYDQVIANGGIASPISGSVGPRSDASDDVIVDGRIITGENYDSATYFGYVIAREVKAALPPSNHAPAVSDAEWSIPENSAIGTVVGAVLASDGDVGQSLSYSIIAGNESGAFAINPATGVVTVANPAALDFEAANTFMLTVRVVDNGSTPLAATGGIVVQIGDVAETVSLSAGNLLLNGTAAADTIYVWSNATPNSVSAWINGVSYGPFIVAPGGRVVINGGDGNDSIFATDARLPVYIFGGAGHDLLVGGSADDSIRGGDGVDRVWGGLGNDILMGDAGNDYVYGREGDDVLLGGDGDDQLEGFDGRDILIGGAGSDVIRGQDGEDVLIGGATIFDSDTAALAALRSVWSAPAPVASRVAQLSNPSAVYRLRMGDTVIDDAAIDHLLGGADSDWLLANPLDAIYGVDLFDLS